MARPHRGGGDAENTRRLTINAKVHIQEKNRERLGVSEALAALSPTGRGQLHVGIGSQPFREARP
jgi:hypothetical protein